MASEIRVNQIQNRSGLTTTTLTDTGVIIAGILTVSENLNVGGVLTYEDVTNIDSVGVITARSTVSIADSIVHTGDTNTSLRFPAADTITAETAGLERLRIDSTGSVGIGSQSPGGVLDLYHATSNTILNVKSGDAGSVINVIDNATRSSIEQNGISLKISSDTAGTYANSDIRLQVDGGTVMMLDHDGYVGINSTSPAAYLDIGAHNTGNPTLRVRNHTSAGAFVNNYGSEFRHTFNSMNHGMLIHTQEAADARRTLDISDANGIFATFTNGKFGMGGLTTPSAKLHALDSSTTTTTILKLRNYASSVNTKPRMAFEASTSGNQGANSYIQGLAGTDAAGANNQNDSGLEFIVTYGGSGTERSAMKLDHDGVCTVPRQPKFNIRCNTNNTFGQGGTYNTNYLSPIPTFTPGNRTELIMRAFDVTYPSYAGGNYPKIVVPVDGFYMFGFAGCYFIQNSSDFVGFGFNVNNEGNASTGSPTYLISAAHSNTNYYDIVHNVSGNVGIQLSANDYVVLYQWSSTSGRFDGNVHLYGYLVG